MREGSRLLFDPQIHVHVPKTLLDQHMQSMHYASKHMLFAGDVYMQSLFSGLHHVYTLGNLWNTISSIILNG